jgi:histone H1/5
MSYKAGVKRAIAEHKDRTGSSLQAIKKAMQASLPVDKKWSNATFLATLKKGVAAGELVQNKGSYKLSQTYKKALADAAKPKKQKKKDPPKNKPSLKESKKVIKKPSKKNAKKSSKKSAKKTTHKMTTKKASKKSTKK